ncbi:hypothetical protein [Pseudoalteromonas spongiae]|uniref:hypothetical protein n=1 Tax=Pseudoalteromonas spongiae TaxID=298657 RepID=UPI00110A532B|nr:hypothetical protein [Pseudoalteromonas spongiae]
MLLTKLSKCSSACAYQTVDELVSTGLVLANFYGERQQSLLQELFLRRLFFDLLGKVCDPLVGSVVQRICLDFTYQPLFALKRFYRTSHGELTAYYKLERELRILSNEFLACKR